ncbi:MAG: IS3 family transposase [Holosporaceae bacterium]|nr:IS3 family transposase [Holosporaceae bacterium]
MRGRFRDTTTAEDANSELQKYIRKYNYSRPHNCLHGMTPMEYINSTYGRLNMSHIS